MSNKHHCGLLLSAATSKPKMETKDGNGSKRWKSKMEELLVVTVGGGTIGKTVLNR
jgi:predicted glycosyltransferase